MKTFAIIATLVVLCLLGIGMFASGLQTPANPMVFILGFSFVMASIMAARDLVPR
jgi:hypothetical protein